MRLNDIKDKPIGVIGYGQEGQATIAYLMRHGIQPVLFDKRNWQDFSPKEREEIHNSKLTTVLGPDYLDYLSKVEIVFRSPGTWRLSPQIRNAESHGLTVTSQVKWFFDHCPALIIGVTGTKGKGTTASLVYHIASAAVAAGTPSGFIGNQTKLFLTGNIGQIQPFDILDDLTRDDLIVYELSSFQLQDLERSPRIGIVLMVTEDHLDRHQSVNEYHRAKEAIVKYQEPADFAIINDDYPASKAIGSLGQGKKLFFSRVHKVERGIYIEGDHLVGEGVNEKTFRFSLAISPLRGQHNWENVNAAILASLILGISEDIINQSLPKFKGLPHRLEKLRAQAGVQFYNDSISTVPDTAIAAIHSFTEPLIVILGGYDKGVQYQDLAKSIAVAINIKALALIGTTALKIKKALIEAHYGGIILDGFDNLRETMSAIKKITNKGDVVLLSPASASFDWYSSYKERGEDFRKLVSDWETL